MSACDSCTPIKVAGVSDQWRHAGRRAHRWHQIPQRAAQLEPVAQLSEGQFLRFGFAKTMARGRIDDEKVASSAVVPVSNDSGQHRAQRGHADHQAGGEQAVQHQGFEFHGGSP